MPRGSDGGKWALAGFLYQIVGALSITTRALAPAVISSGDDSEEVDALVALIANGEELQARHEERGQDAIFTTDDEYVIAQFKYSSTGRKIKRSELEEIIEKLDHGAGEASAQGQNVTACVLVTNREFTSRGGRAAKQLWQEERAGQRDYRLRYYPASLVDFERQLREFGADYGLFESEIEDGINSLVGKVFREAGDLFGASIGKEHILESFTGWHAAEPLGLGAVAPKCSSQLDVFADSIGLNRRDDTAIRREVSDDIARAVNERALVNIHGMGGCGKSVILWQLLGGLLQEAAGLPMIALAKNHEPSWIPNTVHRWRNLPPDKRPSDDPEHAICRLQIANRSASRHILWLALDGLDEGVTRADQRTYIREILHRFWTKDRESQQSGKAPSATLVVSCRREDDLSAEWLDIPYDYRGERPLGIAVGDFSTQEVGEAVRLRFPELYTAYASANRERLGLEQADYTSVAFGYVPEYPELAPLAPRVLEALRHPAMWHALLNLDRALQLRALQGEAEAVHSLAHEFIRWFDWKLGLREQTFRYYGEDGLMCILRSIAAHTGAAAAYARNDDWIRLARDGGGISEHEAATLYREALSAGVIREEDPLSWRWRHMIVYCYLANSGEAG